MTVGLGSGSIPGSGWNGFPYFANIISAGNSKTKTQTSKTAFEELLLNVVVRRQPYEWSIMSFYVHFAAAQNNAGEGSCAAAKFPRYQKKGPAKTMP